MEISKGDFLLVWIFSSLKYCFFPLRYWLFLEISNGIDIVFSFVHNETAHLKVSRRSERLVWNHGHARLFHKKIKEVNVHLEDNLGGHAFFIWWSYAAAQGKSGQFFEYCFMRTYLCVVFSGNESCSVMSQLFATIWTVVHGILQARILE